MEATVYQDTNCMNLMKLSQSKSKYIKSLHRGRYRQKYQNFIAEGTRIVDEMLHDEHVSIELIVALPEWIDRNPAITSTYKHILYEADEKSFGELSLLSTPNQVLVVARQPEQKLDMRAAENGLTLYLDRIQDPGNLGTILRIADWFGIKNVVRSPGTVQVFNPKVIQSSMGAFLRINSPQMELKQLRTQLEGLPVFAATLNGKSVYDHSFPACAILVLGNESGGVSEQLLHAADQLLTIPKGKGGFAESLNASVACGILVSEWARQRK